MNLGPKMAEIRGKNRKPMKIDLPLYNSKILYHAFDGEAKPKTNPSKYILAKVVVIPIMRLHTNIYIHLPKVSS